MIRPLLIVFPLTRLVVWRLARRPKNRRRFAFFGLHGQVAGTVSDPGDIHVEFGEVIETTNNKAGADITVR